ncbi:MAG: nucleotide exchange factor GrpE [Candidatus Omnitrophica bacterium]|nr:nucleotide exchange factor GrpE [Candidatus Omnitrophota bacterium]
MTEETKTQQDIPDQADKPSERDDILKPNSAGEDGASEQAEPKKKAKDKNIKIKESEYERLKDEARDNKDKYMRLFAEFENARKRMDREKMEFIKYANEDLLVEFLGVFDNLELSLNAVKQKQDAESLIKGIEMVLRQAQEILKKNGVTRIEAEGRKFDPHQHEILLQEDNADVEEGTVLQELQKGYKLGEKVIRTVKVKVSTRSSD